MKDMVSQKSQFRQTKIK
uniref:Uncharacterized protein n=1 Tax=Anguilla anguilla TaxID=7936 RepID=A0A0E9QB88_ANGAN